MNIIPETEGDIQGIICSLKSKNTSGYDGQSTEIIKLCSSLISRSFSFICNKSILSGVLPNCLKYAVVSHCTRKVKDPALPITDLAPC
jgi:hypothetical protein